jgi:hypothetical protein
MRSRWLQINQTQQDSTMRMQSNLLKLLHKMALIKLNLVIILFLFYLLFFQLDSNNDIMSKYYISYNLFIN